MATSTAVAPARPLHRSARMGDNAYNGALALDWANGQLVTTGAGTSAASTAFDAVNDRVVMISTDVLVWITVASSPVAATATAGNMLIPTGIPPQPIYVPAGLAVAAIGATAHVSLIPALLGMGG